MRRIVVLLLPALSACANMAGLDGRSEFACKAPDGVVCTSVSGVYANSRTGALPAQKGQDQIGAKPRNTGSAHGNEGTDAKAEPNPQVATLPAAPVAGTPLLSPPKVLRLWLAPWVDEDGDLHDQVYLYVMWNRGEWQIEHTRSQIRQQFAPVAAPIGTRSSEPAPRKEGLRQDARDTVTPAERQTDKTDGDDR